VRGEHTFSYVTHETWLPSISSEDNLSLARVKTTSALQNVDNINYEDFGHVPANILYNMAPALPTNSTEKLLLKTFQEVLHTQASFGVESNLIQWGATSLDIIKLKGHVRNVLGIQNEIPMTTILSNPTVRSLAQALTDKSPHSSIYNPVVTLQSKGNKTPLWLLHPVNGEILIFLSLAKAITDRPVYALRSTGLNLGEPYFSSVFEAVTIYHSAIKTQQPHGPYALAGYAYGSMLAFEIAKVLRANGDEVRFLGAFNFPPHIEYQQSQTDWSLCLLNLSVSLGLLSQQYSASVSPYFPALAKGEAVQHIHHAADPLRMAELSVTGDILADWADVAFAMQSMAVGYEPTGGVDSIDVFCGEPADNVASSSEGWIADYLSRWAEFARDVMFYQIGGGDNTMLGPEFVTTFQKTLSKALLARGV
jgi:thioesterase domain-containing protein/aryl carrier-like protein